MCAHAEDVLCQSLACALHQHAVMATAVVAAWTACIKELQQLLDGTGAVTPAHATAMQDLLEHLHKLEAQPPLPNTAWKKLAQDVQVMCTFQDWGTLLGPLGTRGSPTLGLLCCCCGGWGEGGGGTSG
jgi:hypothetical protein